MVDTIFTYPLIFCLKDVWLMEDAMVELKEINEDNFEECIALKLNKEQSKFIASNLLA